MNFLDKAKKKQAELKAQYDKVSKEFSSFGIGDKASKASSDSPTTQTPTSTATVAPSELDGKSATPSYAELDSTQTATSTTPISTPATTTAGIPEPPSSAVASVPPRQTVKLSLYQRKDVRDTWETSGKPELEATLSKLLGTQWTLDGDAAYLLNVKGDGVAADISEPGNMIRDYMSSAVSRIKHLVEWYGTDAAYEINVLAPKRTVSLEIDTEIVKEVPSDQRNRTDFFDGRIRVLIHRDHLWSNTSSALDKFERVILQHRAQNDQLKNEIDFVAKRGIRVDWEKEVDRILEEAREALDDPGFNFDPRFAEVWRGLDEYANTKAGKKKTKDMLWPETLGSNTWSYFQTLVSKLKAEKFEDDEMLQSTFKESVPKRVAALRLVGQTNGKPHEVVIDDGILYLQTKPEDFFSHTGTVAEKLMDII